MTILIYVHDVTTMICLPRRRNTSLLILPLQPGPNFANYALDDRIFITIL